MKLLDGVRVIDLGHIIAAPFATQLLADLGAEVIKVERPDSGDESRRSRQFSVGNTTVSGLFASYNHGKRSIAVDLKREEGREIIYRLARDSDILVHNFRPRVMHRLALDYTTLSAINNRLIYCGISAFGESGPDSERPGNDLVMQAYSGLMSFNGEPGQPPIRVPISICDYLTGLYAAMGVVGAVVSRNTTGEGVELKISLLESMLAVLSHNLTDYLLTGHIAEPMGSANKLGQPNQAFQTKDGWIVLSAVTDRMWRTAAVGLGLGHMMEDDRFNTIEGRFNNREELIRTVANRIAQLSTSECLELLKDSDANIAEIANIADVMHNPQVTNLGIMADAMWRGETVPLAASAIRVNDNRAGSGITSVIPELGQHTDSILTELGYSAPEIRRLADARVIAEH
jgi:crotonobetainyl-CoA:carnitine CoA-transferase CaiB-like acyl-CoA transferase